MPPAVGTHLQVFVTGIQLPVIEAVVTAQPDGTLTYQVDVPGDLADTPAVKEGGAEGDAVTVALDGKVLGAGVWLSGVDARLDLTNMNPPPPLPSSFYGEIHFDHNPPAAGTALYVDLPGMSSPAAVTAIESQPDGTLTYRVNVPGDFENTFVKEGGMEGDAVTLRTEAGRVLGRGAWHSGVNQRLDIRAETVHLVSGWNLVSFRLRPADTRVEQVLWSLSGSFDLVYAWDAAAQDWLRCDNVPLSTDTLLSMDETMGAWIHTGGPADFEVVGAVPAGITNIALASGWNLVGFPGAQAGAFPASATLVFAFHPTDLENPWKVYEPGLPDFVNDLAAPTPFWGYWVQVADPVVWPVHYTTP